MHLKGLAQVSIALRLKTIGLRLKRRRRSRRRRIATGIGGCGQRKHLIVHHRRIVVTEQTRVAGVRSIVGVRQIRVRVGVRVAIAGDQ